MYVPPCKIEFQPFKSNGRTHSWRFSTFYRYSSIEYLWSIPCVQRAATPVRCRGRPRHQYNADRIANWWPTLCVCGHCVIAQEFDFWRGGWSIRCCMSLPILFIVPFVVHAAGLWRLFSWRLVILLKTTYRYSTNFRNWNTGGANQHQHYYQ